MKRYMLDTNTVSYFIKGHPTVTQHVVATPLESLCISIITKAELLFGLEKRPHVPRLHQAVQEFLLRVEAVPWEDISAKCYGMIRAKMDAQGKTIAPLDLLIAAHALSYKFILVTTDSAFKQISHLSIENWALNQ